MNCVNCKADEKHLMHDGSIEIDPELSTIEDSGGDPVDLGKFCKFWFSLVKYRCAQCGESFWKQDEDA